MTVSTIMERSIHNFFPDMYLPDRIQQSAHGGAAEYPKTKNKYQK